MEMIVYSTGCPVCGAAMYPAENAARRCAHGHVFSFNPDIPSSREITRAHWVELISRSGPDESQPHQEGSP